MFNHAPRLIKLQLRLLVIFLNIKSTANFNFMEGGGLHYLEKSNSTLNSLQSNNTAFSDNPENIMNCKLPTVFVRWL